MATIQHREIREVNTDPQRRCYNGCHYSSEMVWSSWQDLESTTLSRVKSRLSFWKEVNEYAVSQRGGSARREFRVIE